MYDDPVIRPGDSVVCIDEALSYPPNLLQLQCKQRLTRGAVYRVYRVVWLYGEKGLWLEGLDHRPTDGWRASRFRKLQSNRSSVCTGSAAPLQSELASQLSAQAGGLPVGVDTNIGQA